MPFKYTNKDNISLPLAVWLMHDSYDYDKRDNVIRLKSYHHMVPTNPPRDVYT